MEDQYAGRGPNFIWHVEGYDKLKPFGRVMWLEVSTSNNDPSFVARYFVDCVRQVGGTARVVRADFGTENTYIAAIQQFLRHDSTDSFSGENSFMYGKSTSNHRIESWWFHLRRGLTDWWINYFKELRENGLYSDSNIIHTECLRFCFMDLIRANLHQTAQLWNCHRIRPSRNENSPAGRPDLLCFLTGQADITDFKTEVAKDSANVQVCEDSLCTNLHQRNCQSEFSQLASLIMSEKGLQMPQCHEEAKQLYVTIIDEIEKL